MTEPIWLIWNFNSKFGSKILSSEVKLKRKIVFQSICHKILTLYPKKFKKIYLNSNCWISQCIIRRSFCDHFPIIFGWFKVAWAFQKAICLGGLRMFAFHRRPLKGTSSNFTNNTNIYLIFALAASVVTIDLNFIIRF